MKLRKQGRIKNKLLVGLFLFLVSCTNPPDIPICTGFPAIYYKKMTDTFFKLCADDTVCKVKIDFWKKEIAKWTYPTDSGWCRTMVKGIESDVDDVQLYKGKTWKQLSESSLTFPAKESWSPIKTWIQRNCRDSKKCTDGIGDWESTIKSIDNKVGR